MTAPKKKYPSTHRGLLRIALRICSSDYYSGFEELMINETEKPDIHGDRQNGTGFHYFRTHHKNGKLRKWPFRGYLNGLGKKYPSLKSMYDEEMAIAQELKDKDKEESLLHLSRALHMVADAMCPPHRLGWTYFSLYKKKHHKYEFLAAKLFWGEDTPKDEKDACSQFYDKNIFDININANSFDEIVKLKLDSKIDNNSINSQLIATIVVIKNILMEFQK